jgi:hypothetical protein
LVRGTDDKIYINRRLDGGWSGWSVVPGGGATLSAPTATARDGKLRVFVRGTDNKIYVNRLSR